MRIINIAKQTQQIKNKKRERWQLYENQNKTIKMQYNKQKNKNNNNI